MFWYSKTDLGSNASFATNYVFFHTEFNLSGHLFLSQDMEMCNLNVHQQMNGKDVVHIYNAILPSHKKE